MTRLVRVLCGGLRQICLSVWIGGIVMIGAIVAPVAFRDSGLGLEQAGRVVGGSLDRFNVLCVAAGATLLAIEAVEWRMAKRAVREGAAEPGIRALLEAAMLGLVFYLGWGLAPAMHRLQAAGALDRFHAAHHLYEGLTSVQFGLAIGVVFLTAIDVAAHETLSPPPPSKGTVKTRR